MQAKLDELTQEQSGLTEQSERALLNKSNLSDNRNQLQAQFSNSDLKLKNLELYLDELKRQFSQSTTDWNDLKQSRIAEINESIRDKLDSEQREASAEQELQQLKLQIQEVNADIELYEKATTELTNSKEKLSEQGRDYQDW